jgi:type I restriction enzyme S subunit
MKQMKDSGIKWIGEIPGSWNLTKLKFVSDLYIGMSIKDDDKELYSDSQDAYPYIATKDVDQDSGLINYDNGIYTKKDDKYFRIASKQSTLICIEGGSAGRKMAFLSSDVSFGNKLCCFSSNKINSKYQYYYLLSPAFKDEFILNLWGLIGGVSISKLKNFSITLPSSIQQQKIASYLDQKVANIDNIISKTKESIEEYKKYKQSLITETVTKGLNPDVKMKDSGIDWIGEVPEHWKVVNIGKIYTSVLGKMVCDRPDNDSYTLENYLSAINVHFDGINFEIEKQMWFSPNEKLTYKLKIGDLLIVEGGAGAGGAFVFNLNSENDFYIQNSIHLVRHRKEYNTKYLYYWIYSLVNNGYIDYISNKATIPHFTKDKLLNTPACDLSEYEIMQIVDYLDNKCEKIDSFVAQKQKLLYDLEIYKKSLIYEVVTGKKEVI